MIFSPEPKVELVNWFTQSFNNAVATARTCYSSRVIYAEELGKDDATRARRDAIAQSIYEAGHHTTLQHATFQFVLDNVSRQFIWSFLHSHPYYNSEQVSQRYVEVKPERFATPPLEEPALSYYKETAHYLMDAYHTLIELLDEIVTAQYTAIFKNRDPEEKKWASVLKKKKQEIARYVLPLGTHAHLYHTISGLTLHRYHRLCQSYDTPMETKFVVRKMVEAVNQVDPAFFKNIEDEISLEETPEFLFFQNRPQLCSEEIAQEFVEEFDADLQGLSSKLISHSSNAPQIMAQAIRTILGLPQSKLSDAEAIDLVLDPAQNSLFGEALNLTAHAKLTRAMVHPHFTFKKKISHTADSQEQRHRTLPASRPILMRQFVSQKPDYITPVLVQADAQVKAYYDQVMQTLWQRLKKIKEMNVSDEFLAYLLPNAFPIRFEESGNLQNFHHKWTKRLCYTAQEEIWQSSKEEVLQVKEIFPQLGKFLAAPCTLRSRAKTTPYCPEGDRFCGIPVWKKEVAQYERLI